jgi:flagellar biosynthesis protein FlhG
MDQASRLREIVKELKTTSPVPKSTMKAQFFAIASGKGGVGKSNVSVNLAISLAKRGKKVAVVDLDLGLANIDILLDLTIPYTLEHLILRKKTIQEIIVQGPEGITVVPGGSGLARLADLTEVEQELILHSFYELAQNNDYILFDMAAGISHNVIKFALAADEVIVVTTEEPTAITDAYALMKVLTLNSKETKINLLLNMVKNPSDARYYFEKIRGVVKQFLGIEVYSLGSIAYDSCVPAAIMRRKPFFTLYPFSPASKSMKDVTREILLKSEHRVQGRLSFFEKFSHFFGGGYSVVSRRN